MFRRRQRNLSFIFGRSQIGRLGHSADLFICWSAAGALAFPRNKWPCTCWPGDFISQENPYTCCWLNLQHVHACVPSCSVVSDSLWPFGLSPARLLCPWDSPGKNTGVHCHALLQGIFLTQGSNPCLLHFLHWQVGSLPLSHLGRLQYVFTAVLIWLWIPDSWAFADKAQVGKRKRQEELEAEAERKRTCSLMVSRDLDSLLRPHGCCPCICQLFHFRCHQLQRKPAKTNRQKGDQPSASQPYQGHGSSEGGGGRPLSGRQVPVLLGLQVALPMRPSKKINYMRIGTAPELSSPCYVIGSRRDDLMWLSTLVGRIEAKIEQASLPRSLVFQPVPVCASWTFLAFFKESSSNVHYLSGCFSCSHWE